MDLLVIPGRGATFDGPIHQILIAQYTDAIKDFEIPVRWSYGYGNYGMPMPIILHQTTSYLGATINLFIQNVLLTYNLLFLIGAFFSGLFLYIFLRFYVNPSLAFLGVFLFNFAPYRIINIYIRGALPEFFGSVFVILMLISVFIITQKKNNWGIALLIFSSSLLLSTHPFSFAIGLILVVPYFIFNIWNKKYALKISIISLFSLLLGVGMASFYTIPLFLETKYFYYGLSNDQLAPGHFLNFTNYFTNTWGYFSKQEVYTRPHVIVAGVLESIITIFGVSILLLKRNSLSSDKKRLLLSIATSALVLVFFTTSFSSILYQHISLLSKIQHPWRMFSSLIFVAPVIIILLLSLMKRYQMSVVIILILGIAFLRFPQLYTKNNEIIPEKDYYFTLINPDSESFNTIWTGPTESYPVKKNKGEIIEGKGSIQKKDIKNSKRKYIVNAETQVRMADYTFYFPGWNAYVDGQQVPIEFQDPRYRGVITYSVPQGKHSVEVVFENTKPRLLGNLVTLASFIFTAIFLILLMVRVKNKQYTRILSYIRL